MLVNEPVEYPESDQDDTSFAELLPEPEWQETALPGALPPHKWCNFVLFLSKFVISSGG